MIVFDASTLILLAKTDLLEKFIIDLNKPIFIPKAVERESCEEKGSVDALVIQRAIREKQIKVMVVLKDSKLAHQIAKDFGLGLGETEAIAHAVFEKAELLATDDRRAILACRFLKIAHTTAIGILIRMAQKGVLNREEALLKLKELERYGRYKHEILLDAKSKLEVE